MRAMILAGEGLLVPSVPSAHSNEKSGSSTCVKENMETGSPMPNYRGGQWEERTKCKAHTLLGFVKNSCATARNIPNPTGKAKHRKKFSYAMKSINIGPQVGNVLNTYEWVFQQNDPVLPEENGELPPEKGFHFSVLRVVSEENAGPVAFEDSMSNLNKDCTVIRSDRN